jgi:hypothetical protein
VQVIRKKREDDERRQREREEEQRRWAEQQRLREEEKKRIEKLELQMSHWKRAGRIRKYAAALEEFAIKKYRKIDPDSEIGKWISWVKSYADKVDPLTDSSNEDD